MIGLKLFNEKDYTKFRKENKINLKKEEDLKSIVSLLRMLVLTYLFMLIIRPHEIN